MGRLPSSLTIAAAMLLACASQTSTAWSADKSNETQIDSLKNSLDKYQDYKVAVRDLYLSTVGCVHYSGEKVEGTWNTPKGAMGVHFVNVTIQGPPDPMKPNVLIYEPVGKDLKLVAVEWLVPLTPDTRERPRFSANLSWVRWRAMSP